MVRHSADGQCLEFIHPRDSRHVWPQPLLQIGRNNGPAVFGGEDAMVETAGISVGHRGQIVIQHMLNIFLFNSSRPREGGLFSFLNAYPPLKRRAITRRPAARDWSDFILICVAAYGGSSSYNNQTQG